MFSIIWTIYRSPEGPDNRGSTVVHAEKMSNIRPIVQAEFTPALQICDE